MKPLFRTLMAGMGVAVLLAASGSIGCNVKYLGHRYFTGEGRLEGLAQKAYEAAEAGDHARSEELYAECRSRRPESAWYAYRHAAELARLDRTDEALKELQAAATLGFDETWYLEEDPAFRRMRQAEGYRAALETIRGHETAALAKLKQAWEAPPPTDVPGFPTLQALKDHMAFEQLKADQQRVASQSERSIRDTVLKARRVGMLDRYLADHPTAPDVSEARLDVLRARVDRESWWTDVWPRDRAAEIVRVVDELLKDNPTFSHGSEARLYRALALMRGVLDQPLDWWGDPSPPPPDCDAALADLDALAATAPEDRWGGRAIALKAICLGSLKTRDEEARSARAAWKALPEIPPTERVDADWRLNPRMRMLGLRLDGPPPFEATRLDGERVSLASLNGRTTLLEFWGPG